MLHTDGDGAVSFHWRRFVFALSHAKTPVLPTVDLAFAVLALTFSTRLIAVANMRLLHGVRWMAVVVDTIVRLARVVILRARRDAER